MVDEKVSDSSLVDDDEDVEDDNLWTACLSQQAGLSFKEGHLIVCGSAGSGKTSLVRFFGRMEGDSFGEMKKFLMMRYSYVVLDDGQALLNVMQVSQPSHLSVLSEVVPKEQLGRLCYMVVLNAGSPHTVEQEFKDWTDAIEKQQNAMLETLPESKRQKLRDKIYDHIQYYVNPNDTAAQPATEEEKEQLGLSRIDPKRNIGAPLIAVLTQVDTMKTLYAAEALANHFYDILTWYTRLWCVDFGAASFSMAAGMSEQARRILSYVQHRVFDSKFIRAGNAVVSLTNMKEEFLFIPSGYDSRAMIKDQAVGVDKAEASETEETATAVSEPISEEKKDDTEDGGDEETETADGGDDVDADGGDEMAFDMDAEVTRRRLAEERKEEESRIWAVSFLEKFSDHFKKTTSDKKVERKKFSSTAESDTDFLKRMAWDLKRAIDAAMASESTESKDEVVESGSGAAPKRRVDTSAAGAGRSTQTQAVQKLMRTLLTTPGTSPGGDT